MCYHRVMRKITYNKKLEFQLVLIDVPEISRDESTSHTCTKYTCVVITRWFCRFNEILTRYNVYIISFKREN